MKVRVICGEMKFIPRWLHQLLPSPTPDKHPELASAGGAMK